MGADVHVIQENDELFIIWAGGSNGDSRIGTAGQFSRVFCDVTVGGICPWILKSCLGIDILLILNFAPGGAEVIDDVTDGAICVAREVLLQFLKVLGANARDDDFDAHIESGDFGPPLYPESILVGFYSKLFEGGCEIIDLFVYFIREGEVAAC